MKNTLDEAILEEFAKLWKRMVDNGLGKKTNFAGRMIWNVDDTDDEDGYVFADETIDRFLRSAMSRIREDERGRVKDQLLASGHGGGNWRRLVNSL